jgi:A/G-specific adenine glycosylase
MPLSVKRKESFRKIVWDFYTVNSRDSLPWRKSITPYKVWVSEIMLQQTQVDRVIPFFNTWMKLFPNVTALANASQVDVLRAWKGLGYNSRALRMKKTAEILIKNYKGVFPKKYEELLKLPGIGPYTAGAICAFAYNQPVTMIETNIRRVYLHYFFKDQENVSDGDVLEIVRQTVVHENPRQWYWALMDYGSHLGKTIPNPNKKSRHYAVQKKFKGSDREIRGKILEVLLSKRGMEIGLLLKKLADLSTDVDRIESIVSAMESEGFLSVKNGKVSLVK